MTSAEPATSADDMRREIALLTARVERLEAFGTIRQRAAAAPPPSEPPRDVAAIESRLGGYWAARLGIVCVVTGLAFLIADGFDRFGPILKVACGYGFAAALVWVGFCLGRRVDRLKTVLVAGGLGVAYYTTYAMHHVPSVQLIASPGLGFALLAVAVAGIIAAAQRTRSETVAGLALFLGLHTGMVSDVGVFTLASGCLLAAGAGYFLARNRWVIVPISTLVAVYSTLAAWLLGGPGGAGHGHGVDHLETALGFAALYYVTFAIALALAPRALPRLAAAGFALLNAVGVVAVAAGELAYHEAGGVPLVFAVLAACSAALAMVAARRQGRGLLLAAHLVIATGAAALCAATALSGAPAIAALWIVAVTATAGSRLTGAPLWRGAGGVVAGFAFAGSLALADNLVLVALAAAALAGLERLAPRTSAAVPVALDRAGPVAGIALLSVAAIGAAAPAPVITACWIAAAAAMFAVGLALRAATYRLTGLGLAALAIVRLFVRDLASLGSDARIASFLIAGIALLAASYVYHRRAAADHRPR